MHGRRSLCRRFCGFVFLVLALGVSSPGHADDWLTTASSFADYDPLHLPVSQWLRLSVDVEEYHPVVAYADTSSTIRSLAVLPGVLLRVPDQHFQPYIGAGLGLSINGSTPGSVIVTSPLRIEESLVLHVGGGIAYHLGDVLALTGSARFAQFKTTDLLHHIASSSHSLIRDDLDFSTYTVEFGIRLAY